MRYANILVSVPLFRDVRQNNKISRPRLSVTTQFWTENKEENKIPSSSSDLIIVKPCFTDTCLIRTPHYYGQFALSLGEESP